MTWLTLLRLALTLAARIAGIVCEKRLMQAGAAHALRQVLIEQQTRVQAAQQARRKVRAVLNNNPQSLRDDDGYRRKDK